MIKTNTLRLQLPKEIKKIVIFYLTICFLFELVRSFFQAIYGIYYVDSGLTFSQVSTVKIFQISAWLLFEIPSGILADKFGRLKTFMLSLVIFSSAFFLLYRADSFYSFAIAEFIYGIGFATTSGALLAHFNSTKMSLGYEKNINIFGIQVTLVNIGALIGGTIGIGLYKNNTHMPFLASSIGMMSLLIIILFSSKLLKIKYNKADVTKNRMFNLNQIKIEMKKDWFKNVVRIMIFFAFFVGLSQSVYQYGSILFINVLKVNANIFFYTMVISTILGGYVYTKISSKINFYSVKKNIALLLLGLPLVAFYFIENPYILLIFYFISQLGRGFMFSFMADLSNHVISKIEGKSTLLSISGTVNTSFSIIFLLIFSQIISIFSIQQIWSIVGLGYILLIFIIDKKFLE